METEFGVPPDGPNCRWDYRFPWIAPAREHCRKLQATRGAQRHRMWKQFCLPQTESFLGFPSDGPKTWSCLLSAGRERDGNWTGRRKCIRSATWGKKLISFGGMGWDITKASVGWERTEKLSGNDGGIGREVRTESTQASTPAETCLRGHSASVFLTLVLSKCACVIDYFIQELTRRPHIAKRHTKLFVFTCTQTCNLLCRCVSRKTDNPETSDTAGEQPNTRLDCVAKRAHNDIYMLLCVI